MNDDKFRNSQRYGAPSRWRALALGLPPAILMIVVGGYWTLSAWGVFGEADKSATAEFVGPIIAGFGVALAYVCLRPRP
ncbi:hypothetical protein F0U44_18175 [Nocardioides humilatus]|uniref:Uncharacterized protein n=1 Tax=Nocardioides humilatus TaxID=2607660 RepID=A0A5B1LBF2_9ACTN|nr:hypothetical protein [Nocardioides humilatus]KAA1417100.1 hypothetical protein F0U44_18175 [Nocardioides humilatus]